MPGRTFRNINPFQPLMDKQYTRSKLFVRVSDLRPDFRTVITMLWSDTRNVDTEGNALSPASRDWTELYIADREGSAIIVNVFEHSIDPLVLGVESTSDYVAERVAW